MPNRGRRSSRELIPRPHRSSRIVIKPIELMPRSQSNKSSPHLRGCPKVFEAPPGREHLLSGQSLDHHVPPPRTPHRPPQRLDLCGEGSRSRADGDGRSTTDKVQQHESRSCRHRARGNPGGRVGVVGPKHKVEHGSTRTRPVRRRTGCHRGGFLNRFTFRWRVPERRPCLINRTPDEWRPRWIVEKYLASP